MRSGKITFENLENRKLFSAVAWTGAGDGVNWSDAANWSINAMPGASDDVTINVAANPSIVLTGNRTVNSLNVGEALTISGGATLTVAGTGTSNQNIKLNGGTLAGGTWTFNGGAGLVLGNAANVINGATINGDLLFNEANGRTKIAGGATFTRARLSQNGTSIGFAPNSTINGKILFEGAGSQGRYVEMDGGTGSVNIGAAGSIETAAGFGGVGYIGTSFWYGGTMTLNNAGTITSSISGNTFNVIANSMTNTGTMRALNGSTLNINMPTWSSSGAINAIGSRVDFAGTWSNSGTIAIDNSTLNLAGTYSTSGLNLAGFTRTNGGAVNVTGALNNTGSTLNFNNGTGTWDLRNGTVTGGQMNFADGKFLNFTNSGGKLQDVACNNDLTFASDNGHITIGGNTTFGTVRLIGNGTSIGFAPGYVLNGQILFEGAGTQGRYVEMNGGTGTITVSPTGSIKTTPGFAGFATIGGSFWFGGSMTLNNAGLIKSDVTGRTLNIGPSSFNNTGTLGVTDGTLNISANTWNNGAGGTISATGSTLNLSNTWSNAGALSLNNTMANFGGTFSTSGFNFAGFGRTAGSVNITGTLNNASTNLLLNSTTGTWNLSNGAINGGQISFANGQTLAPTTSGGSINNVQVNGDLSMNVANSHMRITGTTRFDTLRMVGGSTSVGFEPGYVLADDIVFEGSSTDTRFVEMNGSSGTFTISPTGSIKTATGLAGNATIGNSWHYGGTMTLVNQGAVGSDVAGRTLNVSPTGGVTTSGTMQAANGGLLKIDTAGPVNVTSTGTATATSFRAATLTVDGTATVTPDSASSDVSIVNALTIGPAGYFDLNNNDLLINYTGTSPKAQVQNLINTGRNGGAWNGIGAVRSTIAKNNPFNSTTLGLLEATEYKSVHGPGASFDGQSIDNTALLIKYTYYGDTDFNGQVNFDDYARIDNGFSTGKSGWLNGDFDANGGVNFDDYSLIDLAFNTQSSPLRPGIGDGRAIGGKLVDLM